ncbi:uncharacterized protein LOC113146752 [Cyclospora cayetanensis]|uniref:Uncharacterized protein LOC113146752 n=1 Tax=Cyclospora cayetanensis TaxID=88456 RepID=A0A6P6RSP5_9EIME|nr:uncharacterized protein LOC113146752 [Cyclospora cayetanensis]
MNHSAFANWREHCVTCLLRLEVVPGDPNSAIVLIGRNAKQNEHLTFSVALPSDFWLHAEGLPGAHVLLRWPSESSCNRPSKSLFSEALSFAAHCAAYFSKGREEKQCRVVCAAARNVFKPPGSPLGTVSIRGQVQVVAGR